MEIGLTFIRIGIGLLFIKHGWTKVMGGKETWMYLGLQMKNFGITFAHESWGLAASCAEFFGGIALVLGSGTRFFATLMACVMAVAVSKHITDSQDFMHPLALLIIFVGFIIAGAGSYSLDARAEKLM
jgi:Predicted membrane protein